MIASLRGRVARVGLDRVVVDVGGVGMLVHTTPGTAAGLRTGSEAELATALVVRDDSLTLYGFAGEEERVVFDLVQTVSGVGPRLALAMLAVLSPDDLRVAIASERIATLTKVPGIGKKGAERLVLELRDKIGAPSGVMTSATPAAGPSAAGWRTPVSEALLGLGWNAKQADTALDAVAGDLGADPDVAVALKSALRELGR